MNYEMNFAYETQNSGVNTQKNNSYAYGSSHKYTNGTTNANMNAKMNTNINGYTSSHNVDSVNQNGFSSDAFRKSQYYGNGAYHVSQNSGINPLTSNNYYRGSTTKSGLNVTNSLVPNGSISGNGLNNNNNGYNGIGMNDQLGSMTYSGQNSGQNGAHNVGRHSQFGKSGRRTSINATQPSQFQGNTNGARLGVGVNSSGTATMNNASGLHSYGQRSYQFQESHPRHHTTLQGSQLAEFDHANSGAMNGSESANVQKSYISNSSQSTTQPLQTENNGNANTGSVQQTPYRSQYRAHLPSTPMSQPRLTSSALMPDSTFAESRTLLENFNNTKQNRPHPSKQFSLSGSLQPPVSPSRGKVSSENKRARSTLRNKESISFRRASTPSSRMSSHSNNKNVTKPRTTNIQDSSYASGTKSFQTLHDHAASMKRDMSTQNQIQARTSAEKEYMLGMEAYDSLHFENALQHFQTALNMIETTQDNDNLSPGDHVEVLANIFLGMGIVYYALGRDKAALELYNRCVECLKERFGSDYPGMVSSLVNIGLIYMNQRKFEEALTTFLKAQKLAENVLGMDRLGLADIYHNIGVIYDSQGKTQDALNYYKRSLRIREKLTGEHPITALTYENMAMIYKDQKQYAEALALQTKVLNIRKSFLGTENSDFALALLNLGRIYKAEGKYKKAITYLQKALKLRNEEFGSNHELTQEAQRVLDSVKAKLNQQLKRRQSMYTL